MTNASNCMILGCGSCLRERMIFISPHKARTRAEVVLGSAMFDVLGELVKNLPRSFAGERAWQQRRRLRRCPR